MGGGDAVTRTDEASSTDERVSTACSTSLDLGVPRPRIRLRLDAADYSHEDIWLDAGNAAFSVVLAVVVVKYLHDSSHCGSIIRYPVPLLLLLPVLNVNSVSFTLMNSLCFIFVLIFFY